MGHAHAQATPAPARPVTLASVATGLVNPWAVAFLPEGRFLVTERPGRMRVVESNGQLGPALAGLPSIATGGQGGLLDVVADTDFSRNRRIFFCYSEPGAAGTSDNSTALARATLAPDNRSLQDVKVLFSQKPKVASNLHFGCRIVQAGDGNLFLALGERYHRKDDAQKLDNHHGKIVRITPDGAVPADNPFRKRAGALPEIWSYGHRNAQGAALAPDGKLWMHEHGPQGGDEINLPQPGRNYGWPVITYGENYGGGKVGEGTARAGMEQPLHYWVPSIAPSGMAFLTSDRYGAAWRGSLFVGSLKFGTLHRFEVAGGKLQREEKLLQGNNERIRDVRQGPDGWLYLLTDSPQGRLLRLAPAP
ncbi:PQQ-dependent sugar dehydrogenase [Acidovorax sp.]|uniref:PQQ-dependent sugar dehydrogenase n=1 Tax=Acidovorax sp. TaxID=1872122 RepID=UPI002ACE5533|nr:PQQ-dependent sugar dehydrogenase [Acidovorax sp.]MDZ7863825.1 PQQ-dependent sugar dehydrogenase [Acidovorax sp.]